jgi:hypothetical protein
METNLLEKSAVMNDGIECILNCDSCIGESQDQGDCKSYDASSCNMGCIAVQTSNLGTRYSNPPREL